MARVPRPRPLVLLVVSLLAASSLDGCYWLRYRDLAITHADLLERMALDARDGLQAGHMPANIGTLRYPLERARGFSDIASRRFSGRPWLESFGAMLEAYDELVDELDRLRVVREARRAAFDRVERLTAEVVGLAAELRSALESEP